MKISKTQFIEYLRCPRYCALDEIKKEKTSAVVEFDELNEYRSEKYKDLLAGYVEQLDGLNDDLGTLEIMLPYFNKIEILTGNFMSEIFNKPVVNSLITKEQKKFEAEFEDFYLYCYTDVYQELDDTFNICEVKAKTTNAIWKLAKSSSKENPKERSIFCECDDKIIRLREETDFKFNDELSEKDYLKIKQKIYDPDHEFGRLILDLSFQRFVVEKMTGKTNGNYYLGVLNNEYIYENESGEMQYDKDANNNEIVSLIDLTNVTAQMQDKVKILIQKVIRYLEVANAEPYPLGKYCLRNKQRECKYYDICASHIPKENSVFAYVSSHSGFKNQDGVKYDEYELVNSGKIHILDVDDSLLQRKNNILQKEQVMKSSEFIDKRKIKNALKLLSYPIYHLDFESLPLPLPRHPGEKCYTQSLFQFSIHIETSPGICDKDKDHYEFLAKDHKDNRRELAEKMLSIIKDDGGHILVYNKAFEKGRIKELAELFPDLRTKLLALNERVFDLLEVLKGSKSFYEPLGYDESVFAYYHYLQSGSFSIKKVLPVFTNLTYEGMDVGNGMEALKVFEKYPTYKQTELKQKQEALVAYCKQDTWAMVKILEGLRRKLDE